jgi:hypothetical protein
MFLNTYELDECGIIAEKMCLASVARRYRKEDNAVIN